MDKKKEPLAEGIASCQGLFGFRMKNPFKSAFGSLILELTERGFLLEGGFSWKAGDNHSVRHKRKRHSNDE